MTSPDTPRFYPSRYHPVNFTKKIVHLDCFVRKGDCAAFKGCEGVSGKDLIESWSRLQVEGFTTEARRKPEQRGGARKNAGAPSKHLGAISKLRVTAELHATYAVLSGENSVRETVTNLISRHGRIKDVPALLGVLQPPPRLTKTSADKLVERASGKSGKKSPPPSVKMPQLAISKSDVDRLDKLVTRLSKQVDHRVNRASVLAAIAKLAKQKRGRK